MELVEGPTLADRIEQGAIPVDEAIVIATQIADALAAAHDRGIVHRDLKPANVKLRADGTVKVLDFGLAKAMDPAAAQPGSVSMMPTITTPAMTQAGVALGTAAYMSPEQNADRPARLRRRRRGGRPGERAENRAGSARAACRARACPSRVSEAVPGEGCDAELFYLET